MMVHNYNWLVVEPYPSEKYEFVSWDDEIPNIWKKNPNHQPDYFILFSCAQNTLYLIFQNKIPKMSKLEIPSRADSPNVRHTEKH